MCLFAYYRLFLDIILYKIYTKFYAKFQMDKELV